jgi:alpha-tubulin suppressor-like RCC1 family protein
MQIAAAWAHHGGAPFRTRFEGMTAVAAGGDFERALDAKRAVWCRGENRKGQCGPGPAFPQSKSPVEVLLPSPQ